VRSVVLCDELGCAGRIGSAFFIECLRLFRDRRTRGHPASRAIETTAKTLPKLDAGGHHIAPLLAQRFTRGQFRPEAYVPQSCQFDQRSPRGMNQVVFDE
jgi:hypothetical protein